MNKFSKCLSYHHILIYKKEIIYIYKWFKKREVVNKMVKTKNKKKGFSLIELMEVMAIIAILALVLVPNGRGVKNKALAAGTMTNYRSLSGYLIAKYDTIESASADDTAIAQKTVDTISEESDFDKMSNPFNKAVIGVNPTIISMDTVPSDTTHDIHVYSIQPSQDTINSLPAGVLAVYKDKVYYSGMDIQVGSLPKEKWTVPSDNTDITAKFTDPNFKAAVYSLIGKTSPAPILYSDVKNITNISLNGNNISNLKGIEYFPNLVNLICTGDFTSIDLSQNTKLITLQCTSNKVTSLDISNNTALRSIVFNGDNLTTLDTSKNNSLVVLSFHGAKLANLDLSNNTSLRTLTCTNTALASLDVSKNTSLSTLNCPYNQITKLYVNYVPSTNIYNPQYTDSTHTTTVTTLTETIK